MVRTKRALNQTLAILKSMRHVLTKKGSCIWKQADGGIQENNLRLFYDIIQVLEALGLVTKNRRPGYDYMRRRKDYYHLNARILAFVGVELNESFSVEKATNEFLKVEKAKIQSQKLELALLSAPLEDMDMDTDEEVLFDCFDPAKTLFD